MEPNPDPNKPMAIPKGSLPLPTDKPGTQHYVLTSHGRFGILSNQYPFDVNVLPAAKIDTFDVQPLHIPKEGAAVKITWVVGGATTVTITPDDDIKGQTLPSDKGDVTVHPKAAKTTYTLTAQGAKGTQPATAQKDVVVDPPTLTSLTADSASVIRGNQVNLSWQGDNFSKLSLSADKGDLSKQPQDIKADATSVAVKPTETTTYTLTATNAGGSVQKQVQVTVSGVTISAFDANPKKITKGQSATLTWQVTGATKIEIQPDVGVVPTNQTSVPVNPQANTAYTLVATGPDGVQVKSQPVNIAVGLGAASGNMAGPTTVTKGESATLAFTFQNAKHIQIKGSDGKTVLDANEANPSGTGNVTVKPDQTTVYTLVVTGDDGTAVPAAAVYLDRGRADADTRANAAADAGPTRARSSTRATATGADALATALAALKQDIPSRSAETGCPALVPRCEQALAYPVRQVRERDNQIQLDDLAIVEELV